MIVIQLSLENLLLVLLLALMVGGALGGLAVSYGFAAGVTSGINFCIAGARRAAKKLKIDEETLLSAMTE